MTVLQAREIYKMFRNTRYTYIINVIHSAGHLDIYCLYYLMLIFNRIDNNIYKCYTIHMFVWFNFCPVKCWIVPAAVCGCGLVVGGSEVRWH